MAALRKVGVASGVANSGSGTVSTLDTLAAMLTGTVSTLTRPANTTPYSAGDSISDNATAGSVTALSATVSDTNDDPVEIKSMLLHSTDTGLGGTRVRAYLFNADPTASTGVVGGDNAAYSNKKNGFIGTLSGTMWTFSDGSAGRLTPDDGLTIITTPTSTAKTIFVQYVTIDGFTPSANSTTLIGTICAKQGRA